MNERPIIMRDWEVRALLEGRKTQTRRIVDRLTGFRRATEFQRSRTPGFDFSCRDSHLRWHDMKAAEVLGRCPFGQPGDRLWVKETWGALPHMMGGVQPETLRYRADGEYQNEHGAWRWRSPLHMPRWASRITLEITDVRLEQVQDISGMDAKREGVSAPAHIPEDGADLDYARRGFRRLWEEIHGGGSWEKNPWVWVIEFKKLEQQEQA
jgi:hypothetical protein